MSTRLQRRVVPKAASYTVIPNIDAPGTTFTNKGAVGAIVFTLPTAIRALLGWHYRFRAVVDQTITVQPPVADTALGLNDLAIDSIALSTGGQKLAGVIEAECVETTDGVFAWAINGISVGHTYTLAS